MVFGAILFGSAFLSTPTPRYTAKFVDLSRFDVRYETTALDATWSLNLAGWTEAHGSDWMYFAPLCLVVGRPRGMDALAQDSSRPSHWIVYIQDRRRAFAVDSAYDIKPQRPKPVVWNGKQWVDDRKDRPAPQRRPRVQPGIERAVPMPPWAQAPIATREKCVEDPVDIHTYALGNGASLVSVYYRTFNPETGSGFHGVRLPIDFLRKGDKTLALESCVVRGPKLSYQDVVWVSPEGWLVLRASQGEKDGYAWLYPHAPSGRIADDEGGMGPERYDLASPTLGARLIPEQPEPQRLPSDATRAGAGHRGIHQIDELDLRPAP